MSDNIKVITFYWILKDNAEREVLQNEISKQFESKLKTKLISLKVI